VRPVTKPRDLLGMQAEVLFPAYLPPPRRLTQERNITMNQADKQYQAGNESAHSSIEFSVEELNIVDLDDRLELADRCNGNTVKPSAL